MATLIMNTSTGDQAKIEKSLDSHLDALARKFENKAVNYPYDDVRVVSKELLADILRNKIVIYAVPQIFRIKDSVKIFNLLTYTDSNVEASYLRLRGVGINYLCRFPDDYAAKSFGDLLSASIGSNIVNSILKTLFKTKTKSRKSSVKRKEK